jgi:hypothetical protein
MISPRVGLSLSGDCSAPDHRENSEKVESRLWRDGDKSQAGVQLKVVDKLIDQAAWRLQ